MSLDSTCCLGGLYSDTRMSQRIMFGFPQHSNESRQLVSWEREFLFIGRPSWYLTNPKIALERRNMYSRPHAAGSQAPSRRMYVRPSTGCFFRPVLCSIGFSEWALGQGVSAAVRWRRFFLQASAALFNVSSEFEYRDEQCRLTIGQPRGIYKEHAACLQLPSSSIRHPAPRDFKTNFTSDPRLGYCPSNQLHNGCSRLCPPPPWSLRRRGRTDRPT